MSQDWLYELENHLNDLYNYAACACLMAHDLREKYFLWTAVDANAVQIVGGYEEAGLRTSILADYTAKFRQTLDALQTLTDQAHA